MIQSSRKKGARNRGLSVVPKTRIKNIARFCSKNRSKAPPMVRRRFSQKNKKDQSFAYTLHSSCRVLYSTSWIRFVDSTAIERSVESLRPFFQDEENTNNCQLHVL